MKQKYHSSPVKSAQTSIHADLASLVKKHMTCQWRQPLHPPTVEAFKALLELGLGPDQKIVFDSGCGTGLSTRLIAEQHSDCLVIGIDKSTKRLGKLPAHEFPHREANAIWVRAELTSFWRLALGAGWRLHRHYILYPNPWPKPGQILRRWHAHPVFPDLLRLGGRLEMRSNWEIYAREFAAAAGMAGAGNVRFAVEVNSDITSPFEIKYRNSGQTLYSVLLDATRIATDQ